MKTLSAFALRALSTVEVSGQTARVVDTLDRKLYLEVNDALVALGGKWSRKLKSHVFDGKTQDDIKDALEDVLACGGFVDKKQELGAFFTPAGIADQLVRLAEIEPNHKVLEPSAGAGHLIEAIRRNKNSHDVSVHAIEIDHDNAESMKRSALLMPLAVVQMNFLTMNFLAMKPDSSDGFDRILMNPPFRRGADVEHVLHAWKFLKPGGRLVSVMSAHATFAQDKRSVEFRAFVRKNGVTSMNWPTTQTFDGAVFCVLPDGSFASAGTNVNTVVVVLEKSL